MATTGTQDRPGPDVPNSSATTEKPAARANGRTPPAQRRRGSTVLLRLAVVIVAGSLLASLFALSVFVPDVGNVTTLSGRAMVAGLVAMFSTVAAFTLAFLAAVRAGD